jgi:hypothetical protein
MIRRLYELLIRSHPDRFRRRFGEQMLSIFDDSTRVRSGFHLLTDAFVSLLRQHLLRTECSRAEQLQENASRVNVAWAVGALGWYVIVAAVVHPAPATVTQMASLFYTVLQPALWLALYLVFSPACAAGGHVSSIATEENRRRRELENHLDSLRRWSEYMGPLLITGTLIWPAVAIVFALLGGYRPQGGRTWGSVNLIVFAIQTALFFAFVKPRDERAVRALNEEIVHAGKDASASPRLESHP